MGGGEVGGRWGADVYGGEFRMNHAAFARGEFHFVTRHSQDIRRRRASDRAHRLELLRTRRLRTQ